MILLLGFAFVAGIVTILSPCILPILPIVLSSSTGGKKKPLGVVTGFILSFTFFTLFLSSIVKTTGISADSLRFLSVIVIAGFGISLLIPQFQLLIEKLFTRFAGLVPKSRQNKEDFSSGFLIGLSVGLLWTPCVGPILASVISLALTGAVSGSAFFITLSYSLGTAIPMFAIMYGGRELLNKNQWLLRNTANIQKAFGVLMIITAAGIYFNLDRTFQAYIVEKFPQYGVGLTKFEDNDRVKKQLAEIKKKPKEDEERNVDAAPEIIEGGQWFNSSPLKIKNLKNKVVLIDFWTYTCINCIRTIPYLRAWHEKYNDKGLVIIGVHTPEFEFEKNPENVQKAIEDLKITYPVIQDNEYATWQAYNNHYWPAKYLIDADGNIRYTHFGEGKYEETEKTIQALLEEAGSDVDTTTTGNTDETPAGVRTPETYLGSLRGYGSVSFEGQWIKEEEYAESKKNATLTLPFYAKKVFLVITPAGNDSIEVFLDDKKSKTIQLDTARLYELVTLNEAGDHVLKLKFNADGTRIFAFTFG